MSPSTTAPSPVHDEDLVISVPLAVSEVRALEKSRLINPDPPPRQPILAPLERETSDVSRRTMAFMTAWLLIGAGLSARATGLVDTTPVDSVAIADLEPVENWIDDNLDFTDNLGIPRQLAATDEAAAPTGQINSQVVSTPVDDPDLGLNRDNAEVEPAPTEPAQADTANDDTANNDTANDDIEPTAADGDSARGSFALAWSQWLGNEHLVTGEVVRQRLEGDTEPITIAFQAARKGDTAVQQLGSSAVVDSPRGRQTCERAGDGTMLCTPPSADSESQGDEIQAIAALLTGPSPAYLVEELPGCPGDVCSEAAVETTPRLADAACWTLTANIGSEGQRWGQNSTFCFDPTSKALVARQTTSTNRVETFVASIIRDHVDNHELQPK